ncbi:MAG: hypothetical protein VX549_09040 [Pseudomonadota bacterium]|nr:hypothetical protein [Pseudomonadota bacterium]
MKNRDLIASNIAEARDELNGVLEAIGNREEYDEVELQLALEHAFHHLSYAWNIRDASPEVIADRSRETFKKLSRFPLKDIEAYE